MKFDLRFFTLSVGAAAVIICGFMATQPVVDPADRTRPVIDPALEMPAPVAHFVMRSCVDCHTNHTRWPWYASFPPMSKLIMHDVQHGREAMNFSEWSRQVKSKSQERGLLQAACVVVQAGGMPLPKYLALHPDARPTPGDVKLFCDWVNKERLAKP